MHSIKTLLSPQKLNQLTQTRWGLKVLNIKVTAYTINEWADFFEKLGTPGHADPPQQQLNIDTSSDRTTLYWQTLQH